MNGISNWCASTREKEEVDDGERTDEARKGGRESDRGTGYSGGWGGTENKTMRRDGKDRTEWMSENWRPQLPFQLWPSRTPTPVKINVSRCGLATNRSANVASSLHPPALGAHLKIHVHLRAASEVATKRGPACSGSPNIPRKIFQAPRASRRRRFSLPYRI